MHNQIKVANFFQKIYIINLLERKDRRNEIKKQLHSIGMSLDHPNIQLFEAIQPEAAGEFDTIGTKGCFLSHLTILKDALHHQYERILILEDDVNFSSNFNKKILEATHALSQLNWSFFYGGHRLKLECHEKHLGLTKINTDTIIETAHFIALQNNVISIAVKELELMLSRKNGDPNGGPMHVDGAYSTIRKNYPRYNTYASSPPLAYQRASRSDIHSSHWFDNIFILRGFINILRKLKNTITHLTQKLHIAD